MSGIVQKKSGVATGTSVSVSFDSPVAKGNLLIAAIRIGNQSLASIGDGSNSYFIAQDYLPTIAGHLYVYKATSGAAGSLTLTITVASSDTLHLHIYEVNGYDTTEQIGSSYSNTSSPSVSTVGATTHANEFVFGLFASDYGSGVTWTPGSGFGGGITSEGAQSVFTEGKEVTSTGVQAANATVDFGNNTARIVVTFYSSGGPTPPPPSDNGIFLGSVTEVGNVPAGQADIFLGTVTVVSSVPAGRTNPYLGKVKLGSPSGSQTNPSLGEVVVVGSAPAIDTDPYLGAVATS